MSPREHLHQNEQENSAVKAQYDRQNKYATLRGYMMAKNMATVQTDGSVKITVCTYTTTVAAGVVSNGTGGSGNGGSGNGGGSTTQTMKTLTLSVSPAGAGTATGAGQYAQGTIATITATAATGYTFTKWSDNNTSATRNVTVNGDMTLLWLSSPQRAEAVAMTTRTVVMRDGRSGEYY